MPDNNNTDSTDLPICDEIRCTDPSHRKEVILLNRKLEEHIAEGEDRWNKSMALHQANTAGISEIKTGQQEVIDNTKDMVAAWTAATGTVKVAKAVGNFVKWLSGFAVFGTIITYFSNHIPK